MFESRIHPPTVENVNQNKITWFKSLSPKPKNIIFKYTGSPQIVTANMITESRIREGNSMENPESPMTPVKSAFNKNHLQQSVSTNAYDSMIKDRKMKSS